MSKIIPFASIIRPFYFYDKMTNTHIHLGQKESMLHEEEKLNRIRILAKTYGATRLLLFGSA